MGALIVAQQVKSCWVSCWCGCRVVASLAWHSEVVYDALYPCLLYNVEYTVQLCLYLWKRSDILRFETLFKADRQHNLIEAQQVQTWQVSCCCCCYCWVALVSHGTPKFSIQCFVPVLTTLIFWCRLILFDENSFKYCIKHAYLSENYVGVFGTNTKFLVQT